ncbi:MAG: glycosyltransferase [Planctomycetota bacterium]
MRDLIYISMENWQGVWRRNQNLVMGFAQRFPEQKFLYVNLPLDLSYAVRRGRLKALVQRPASKKPLAVPQAENVFEFTPTKWLPHTLPPTRLLDQAWYRHQVRRAADELGLVDPMLYINPHWGSHTLGRMGERLAVYDVGDDWTCFYPPGRMRDRSTAEDRKLTQDADLNVVVSERLVQIKDADAKRMILNPNGVDVERYRGISDGSIEVDPRMRGLGRPVIAHTGTLHPSRTDLDLLLGLARRMPDVTVALIGPNFFDDDATSRLAALPNVKLMGAVDYFDVPGMMAGCDLMFVPHQVNDFSESQSPLKLFEYLASGLPVVTTPVAGFRDQPDLVYLAEGLDAFVDAVRAGLSEDPAKRAPRLELSDQHSWTRRIDEILAAIDLAEAERNPTVSTPDPSTAKATVNPKYPAAEQLRA